MFLLGEGLGKPLGGFWLRVFYLQDVTWGG